MSAIIVSRLMALAAGALLALAAVACASPAPTSFSGTNSSDSSHRTPGNPLPIAESPAWEPLPLMGEDGRNEATTISAGSFHTCAIRLNTAPVCWGANQYKQSSTLENSYVQGVMAITAGGAHTCMLHSDNSLFCNGSYFHFPRANRAPAHNDSWPLPGDPHPEEINSPINTERFWAISSGLAHACALPLRKSVVCWGRNTSGEASPFPWVQLRAVSSGGDFTCGLRVIDQSPVCWGRAYWAYSDIIDGGFDPGSTPIRCLPLDSELTMHPSCYAALELTGPGSPEYPPLGERFASISSGWYHVCALRLDGTPVCWGNDELGQASPPGDERFAAVSSGGFHTCGLRSDGTPVCWGNDESGQASPPKGERFAAISSGAFHTCALRFDGAPVCWGDDYYGQASPPKGERFML